ncbi:unnamed protein product [Ilex paraguariensis]|uniref:Uncharacterized protein n=1 Tax=Ilex paraguariensis TaxID=185542 RepID=A0ABC8RBU6_9AQUA
MKHRTIEDIIDGQDFVEDYVEKKHSVVIEEINEDDVEDSQIIEVLKIDYCNRKNLLEYSEVNAIGDAGGEEQRMNGGKEQRVNEGDDQRVNGRENDMPHERTRESMENDMPHDRNRESIRDSDSSDYSELYDS